MLSKIFRIGRSSADKSGDAAKAGGDTAAGDAATTPAAQKPKINTKETYVLRYDENGANFKLAQCCGPIPGDDVLGFITDEGEVEIHALDCPRAQMLKAGYGTRIVATRWETEGGKYLAHVRIEGIDRHGILQELIQMISTHLSIDIRKLDIEASGEVFTCDLWVRVASVEIIKDLCHKTQTIDGVKLATRIA